ncbi:MAG: HTTM domain-containing protein [Candidatus Obscuribacterales bacterium]|nr:HTTM domain-containing protein [Candidatus Obscuribacterales bacterium]
MTLRELWLAWNEFWFAPGSPMPLAVFRIAIGVLVLIFCWWISPEATQFLGLHRIVQSSTVAHWMGSPQFDVLSLLPKDDYWISAALNLLALSGICLILGVFSRLNALIVYLIMLAFDSRNHFVLNTGIKIMIVMTLFLVFSRCGEALSFKRIASVWRKKNPDFGPARDGSVFALRLMQVQMALVYWSAGSCKLHGASWMDGTAVYYAAHLTQFQRFTSPLLDQLWLCSLLSLGTLAFELSFPFLIWVKELRYPLLFVGALFHAGLDWAMVIPLFQPVMMAGYLPFIEAKDFGRMFDLVRSLVGNIFGEKVRVAYDDKSAVASRLAETVRRLDVFHLTQLKSGSADSNNGLTVSIRSEKVGMLQAVRVLSLRLPLLLPLYPVTFAPGIEVVMRRIFQTMLRVY